MRRVAFLHPIFGVCAVKPLYVSSRFGISGAVPYGSVPADIEQSRYAQKPREEDVMVGMSRRTASGSRTGGSDGDGATAAPAAAEAYDPWRVLGLTPDASSQMVRMRYHELMRQVHPDLEPNGVGDIPRLNQINKAYEIITKSPTIDRRYRSLVSDTQHFYYRFLPEWMARNVDEMPRYWSWVKWRTPGAFQLFLWCCGCYMIGRFYASFPLLTTAFVMSLMFDILFHTMTAPATCSMLFLYAIMSSQSHDMAWLTSPKSFLRRELGY